MFIDCPTCEKFESCEQQERWEFNSCINYKAMPTRNPTNADRIRQMTDEEMAEFLYNAWETAPWCSRRECYDEPCVPCWLEWLKGVSE